jgi:sigma-B regulation protein RsbU (phosphoserine phosphatase)
MNSLGLFANLLASEEPRAAGIFRSLSGVGLNRRRKSYRMQSFYPSNVYQRPAQQTHLETELALAARIQARLFPAVLPNLACCQLAARNRPALLCGGDYYDVLPTADDRDGEPYLLCVADVSGKGLPASLLMSNFQATLRTSISYRPPLMDLVASTNKLLYATTPPDKFITAILVNCEPVTGRCIFVNAGHNGGVLIRSNGEIVILKTTGPPLGMMNDLPFLSDNIELHAGDVLTLYSDGVPEAFDSNGEEWGDERFMSCLRSCCHLSSQEIVTKVFDELDAFAQNIPQHDDITMLVLKRKY